MDLDQLKKRILNFIDSAQLLSGGESILVAFSGGSDSTMLLDFLLSVSQEMNLTVYAAHFNHLLRGEEALRDLRFCRSFCADRGVEFFSGEGDVLTYAEHNGLSLEMAARQLRYEFLARVSAKLDCVIATAHNANDNVETMLLNFTRGSGTRGLCGIPLKRDNIIRPVLCCTKREILAYCEERGLAYVNDSTNESDAYGRNAIRHHVIPVLRSQNESLEQTALRTSLLLRDADQYVSAQAEELINTSKRRSRAEGGYDCSVLREAEKPLRSRAAAIIFEKNGVFASYSEIIELERLIVAGSGHRVLKNIPFDACKDTLTISDETPFIEPVAVSLGENWVGGRRITLQMSPKLSKNAKNAFKTSLNYDIIKGSIFVRSRNSGDIFHPANSTGGKTVKKLFNEIGIPAGRRNSVMLLCDDEGVLFIEGVGADKRAVPALGSAVLTVIFDE